MISLHRLRNLVLIVLMSVLFTRLLSAHPLFPEETGESGLIFFNRAADLSSSEFYRTILVFDVLTGEESPVTSDNDVSALSWSHDKTHILAAQTNGDFPYSLVILDADGKNRSPLVPFPDIVTSGAQWSPDDQRIIFWGSPIKANPRYWAIFDIPAAGGEIRRLTEPFFKSGSQGLTISPDGSRILFTTRDGMLYSMSANGGDVTHISLPFKIGATLEWLPDGTQITVAAYDSTKNENVSEGLYLITPDGRERHLLIPNRDGLPGPSHLQWSPDGSQLLFVVMASDALGYKSLGILTRDTGEIRRYQAGEGILAAVTWLGKAIWSPDGTEIVFSAGTQAYPQDLYRVDREFTLIQRLTEGWGHDQVIDWQP